MKPRLVFLSGWSYPPSSLAALEGLLARSFEVRVVAPEPLIGAQAAEVFGPEVGPVLLGGWSLGAMLAIQAAAALPERVEGLLLVGATPRFCSGEGFTAGVGRGELRAMMMRLRKEPEALLEGFRAGCAAPFSPQPVADELRAAEGAAADLSQGLAYLDRTDLRSICQALRLPCRVIHGREDRIIPWKAGEWLARNIAGARWTLLDEIGHDVPLREPETLRRAFGELSEQAA